MPAARLLQRHFTSWSDLGQNHPIGREFWSLSETQRSGDLYRATYQTLISYSGSPWNSVPVELELTRTSVEPPRNSASFESWTPIDVVILGVARRAGTPHRCWRTGQASGGAWRSGWWAASARTSRAFPSKAMLAGRRAEAQHPPRSAVMAGAISRPLALDERPGGLCGRRGAPGRRLQASRRRRRRRGTSRHKGIRVIKARGRIEGPGILTAGGTRIGWRDLDHRHRRQASGSRASPARRHVLLDQRGLLFERLSCRPPPSSSAAGPWGARSPRCSSASAVA